MKHVQIYVLMLISMIHSLHAMELEEAFNDETMRQGIQTILKQHDANNRLTLAMHNNIDEAKRKNVEDKCLQECNELQKEFMLFRERTEGKTIQQYGQCPLADSASYLRTVGTYASAEMVHKHANILIEDGTLELHHSVCKCGGGNIIHFLARTNARLLEAVLAMCKEKNIAINFNERDSFNKLLPLQHAKGNIDSMIVLLRYGADPATLEYFGERVQLIKLLCERIEIIEEQESLLKNCA